MGQAVSGSKGPSLRFRIAGGVLAGLVVLFSFFGFLAIRTINLSVDIALEDRLRLAQISAASVDELLEHTAGQLERAAAFVRAGPIEGEEGRAEVAHELLSEFSRVVRLSPEARVLWIVPPRTDDVGWAFADDEAVRAAVGRTETSIVVPAPGSLADGLIAILVTPLDRRDRSAGFLAGELRASHADVNLLSLPGSAGSVHSEIVDAAGYIVFESDGGEPTRLDEHADVLASMIASGRSGTTIHRPEGGADHVVAYYPFRSRPGGLVIEQTEDAALAIPLEMQRMMLVYGIGALLIASVAAWLHAHSVVRPIRHLTGEAARMASGDLDNPITVSRDDEIGELAMRFDEMRVKLKASHDASAHWTEELEDRVRERTREVEHKNLELNVLSQTRRQLLAKTISA
ncbi:MAG: HAMP domain-containing protein, partial [Candidatus Limnocylindrales bacterium]